MLQHSSPTCLAISITLAGQAVLSRANDAAIAPRDGTVALVEGQDFCIGCG